MKQHDVIIIGGGPAGLSAARRLGELGIRDVVLLEREDEPGGVPRHCGHLAFGMREFHRVLSGPAYARRLAETVRGLDVRTRTTVTAIVAGGQIQIEHPESGPSALSGRRVLLTLGLRETPRSARLIGGDRPWGVTTTGALQQFVFIAGIRPFQRAVVIGSELVAFSALLTLRHGGMSAAAMIEPGPRITARRPGDWIARLLLGVPVLTETRLVGIHGLNGIESVEVERAGERRHIACDGVVFTGGFRPETALLAPSHLAIDPGTQGPAIDQHWRCSDPHFFAAGNLLHPVETAGVAWAEGRAAAEAITADLGNRLPPVESTVPITAVTPLRYVYPQRLALPLTEVSPLLLKARAMRAARGRLRLVADGRELWSRRMSILPERRLSLPTDLLPRARAGAITVDFVEEQ
jgi:NADPH-dependent 2,4-dienoyl-CoA reductase/sulfur reductase-like enzyme